MQKRVKFKRLVSSIKNIQNRNENIPICCGELALCLMLSIFLGIGPFFGNWSFFVMTLPLHPMLSIFLGIGPFSRTLPLYPMVLIFLAISFSLSDGIDLLGNWSFLYDISLSDGIDLASQVRTWEALIGFENNRPLYPCRPCISQYHHLHNAPTYTSSVTTRLGFSQQKQTNQLLLNLFRPTWPPLPSWILCLSSNRPEGRSRSLNGDILETSLSRAQWRDSGSWVEGLNATWLPFKVSGLIWS